MKQPKSRSTEAFLLFALFLSAGCTTKHELGSSTIVLSYQELGPQAAVHKLIGNEWYQWNSHGDSDPNKIDNVKIVVYRNISLDKIKEMYPVINGKQDYRYLDYETAIDYLSKHEHEPYLEHLHKTRKKIIEQLGS